MIANTINLMATNNTVGITDFFDETDKSYQTYQGIKETIAKDPSLAKMLQNPNLKPEQKEQMLNQIADSVMVKLGYTTYDTKLIDTTNTGRDGKQIKGFYSTETNKAYINDQNNNSTAALVTTAGHEATRAMDDQNKENFDKKREDRNDYAQTFGENLASYTNMALNINGYNQGMATENPLPLMPWCCPLNTVQMFQMKRCVKPLWKRLLNPFYLPNDCTKTPCFT